MPFTFLPHAHRPDEYGIEHEVSYSQQAEEWLRPPEGAPWYSQLGRGLAAIPVMLGAVLGDELSNVPVIGEGLNEQEYLDERRHYEQEHHLGEFAPPAAPHASRAPATRTPPAATGVCRDPAAAPPHLSSSTSLRVPQGGGGGPGPFFGMY